MPSKREFMEMMLDADRFATDYREENIDPDHQAADDAYHGVLPNEAEYMKRGRSMLFIPKTRDHVRKWTSIITNAFYASDDIVTNSYPADLDKQKFTNEVFNIRLELEKDFYVFLRQSAHATVKYGNAIGKTGWEYKDGVRVEVDKDMGTLVTVEDPIVDRPFFEVVPFENVQYDYRCIGNDPMQDSPFLRHFTPAYITDVEFMFKNKQWKKPRGLSYDKVMVSSTDNRSSVRRARLGGHRDPTDENFDGMRRGPGGSYDQVWVVENYFRVGGTDWTFLSLGNEYILTEPERVVDKFAHGKRPFAMSTWDPEAFKSTSNGLPYMMGDLQAEINAIRNQRRDNVSLVLNARHYVSRQAKIEMATLYSSMAGGAIIGHDVSPDKIRREEVTDVTASAYREEEISSRDIEEISAQSENKLGVATSDRTTATEAAIKASSAGEMEGYVVKNFVETYIRPLLEMFHDNLLEYEDDEEVFMKAALATGLDPDPELLVRTEIVINAGMGTMNKEIRSMRWEKVINLMIQSGQGNVQEAFAEWLALVGVKNTKRFLPQATPAGPNLVQSAGPPPSGAPSPLPEAPGSASRGAEEGPGTANFGGLAGGLLQ